MKTLVLDDVLVGVAQQNGHSVTTVAEVYADHDLFASIYEEAGETLKKLVYDELKAELPLCTMCYMNEYKPGNNPAFLLYDAVDPDDFQEDSRSYSLGRLGCDGNATIYLLEIKGIKCMALEVMDGKPKRIQKWMKNAFPTIQVYTDMGQFLAALS